MKGRYKNGSDGTERRKKEGMTTCIIQKRTTIPRSFLFLSIAVYLLQPGPSIHPSIHPSIQPSDQDILNNVKRNKL